MMPPTSIAQFMPETAATRGIANAFEPLRQKYLRQASAIETSGDLDAQWLSGDAAVARSMREVQPQRPAVGMPSSTREEIQGRGATIRQDVQGRSGSFDQNADVSRTEDGTLKSPRSLLKKSAKQVGNDAKESFDSAKEAVGDLLKRK